MDINEIKHAWDAMNCRIEQQDTFINNHLYQKHLDKSRNALWPLFVGQIVQLLAGLSLIILGLTSWQSSLNVTHIFISGLAIHVYGILMTILSGIMLGKIRSIDYSAPVVEIQQKLAKLRFFYIVSSRLLGLSWWVLWVPFAITLFAVTFGVDMYSRMPLALTISLVFGALGLIATWLFHRWTKHPSRTNLRSKLDKAETGTSLRRAQEMVNELARFKNVD